MPPRVAVSSSFQRNGQKHPEALLKQNQVSFARLACLYVLVCASLCFKTRTSKAKIGEGHG